MSRDWELEGSIRDLADMLHRHKSSYIAQNVTQSNRLSHFSKLFKLNKHGAVQKSYDGSLMEMASNRKSDMRGGVSRDNKSFVTIEDSRIEHTGLVD